MLDALATEERALRRRLLFRLLKDYDFDATTRQSDLITAPIAPLMALQTNDHFVFSFETNCD